MNQKNKFLDTIQFIKSLYAEEVIPLHAPKFNGNEKKYLNSCIDSTFVSSIGEYVTKFEEVIAAYVGTKYALACTNGTSALHLSLYLLGADENCEVITQGLSFVATANAIAYTGADLAFIDSDEETLGMCPKKLKAYLEEHAKTENGITRNKISGKKIIACIPMHVFGHPVKIEEILEVCNQFKITVLEDAAESLGSFYKSKHTGSFGKLSTLSFNGNKIVTTGGGGAIVTNDETIYRRGKHVGQTAKVPHAWEYFHDEMGFNYRLPNLNAALGVAQFEELPTFLKNKRETAQKYATFFKTIDLFFVNEPTNCQSNFWLNGILLKDKNERDQFLELCKNHQIQARPCWILLNQLPMFKKYFSQELKVANNITSRLVNLPSSVR